MSMLRVDMSPESTSIDISASYGSTFAGLTEGVDDFNSFKYAWSYVGPRLGDIVA